MEASIALGLDGEGLSEQRLPHERGTCVKIIEAGAELFS